MVYTGQLSRQQRAASAGAALAAVALIGAGLASGLDLSAVRTASEAITAIALPAPPPEAPPLAEPKADKAAGQAAPPAKVAKAAPVAAPEPKIRPPDPPPVAAAPSPGKGTEPAAGAAPAPGPGSAAGGRGDGTGSGGSGDGTGGGGTRPVLLGGRIEDSDYPKAASRAKSGGEVEVRFTVQPTGRATGCRITRSSGDASLDATTCRLIEERFRFRPATNAAGTSIATQYGWRQRWWLERR
ncbi:energy transducer TonB [Sphingopyxis indica]|uniref:Protein TonB n=1 Tax=Sphingopyxis indica TaxID=436663 RepID=A0A239EBR1_9SPHN|nr:energy transducer TonB [Sphingopyxis indica]SNS41463.1 protein TonB [Sphingopyxis indica]